MAHHELHPPVSEAQVRALRIDDTVTLQGTLEGDESTIEGILSCRQPRRAWIVSYPVTIAVHKGETHPRRHKTGIQLHCLLI